jgi:phage-related protein
MRWQSLTTVAMAKCAIWVRLNEYRAIYLATLPDAVHVYHGFKKTTQKTEKHDLEVAKKRYGDHMMSLKK